MHRYKRGNKLAGILYFHRISDLTMDWISTMNFKMFQKLCGKGTLRNAVIVTNMWGQIDRQVGEAREVELVRDDTFFKFVIDRGAQIARNENTVTSAQNVIRLILDNHPLPLRIQRELVDEHKDISATSASEQLYREINTEIKKYREEMRVVKEMRALKEETHVLKEQMRVLNEEMREMRHENKETKRELHKTRKELQKVRREMETR